MKSAPDAPPPWTIAGGGLAGTLLALELAARGAPVRLIERHPDPDIETIPSGRSINLALARRGLKALAGAGLEAEIKGCAIPMRGRMIHDNGGAAHFQPYSRHPERFLYSIQRDKLNRILLDRARRQPEIELQFERQLTGIDWPTRRLQLQCWRNRQTVTLPYDRLIGCDGAGSGVRRAIDSATGETSRVDWLTHGYREFTLRAALAAGENERQALHIWPRGEWMLIALPNVDGSFTATLFMERDALAALDDDPERWRVLFATHFADALPYLERLEHDLAHNPAGRLGTVHAARWYHRGALLLGDAAHAVVPFHGQGMNAAFEDVSLLVSALDRGAAWPALAAGFQARRQPDTDALARMALDNYREMRAAVRDPGFMARKALEWQLENDFPERFMPRYDMVMFSDLPYAVAEARGAVQLSIIDELIDLNKSAAFTARAQAAIETQLPALPAL